MKTNNIFRLFVIILAIFLSFGCTNNKTTQEEESAPKNWAEKLGYPAGKKVIILHADDAGMCEEANTATAHLLENDYIQSAAIMAPCPSADDFILWAIDNPKEDIGMHLTLTSEWKEYRWGPITPAEEVPGLIDPEGMLWHEVPQVVMSASAEEVEKEIRAQIDKAIAMGHQPTHIDTHMGTLYGHPSYVQVFFKVAEDSAYPLMILTFQIQLLWPSLLNKVILLMRM